jgi:hypothetical protein
LHPAAFQWSELEPGLRGLVTHLTGAQFQRLLGRFAPSELQQGFLSWYVYPFLLPGLLVGLGAAARARCPAERTILWSLAASALLGTAYAFDYGVPDPSSYFLHPLVLGLAALAPLVGGFLAGGASARRAALTVSALLGLAATVLTVPWLRTGRQRGEAFVSFDRLVHQMWLSIPADSGVVFWTSELTSKLREYQLLRGEKPGLTAVNGFMLYTPGARLPFMRRYGFDPVAGIALPSRPRGTPAADEALIREAVDSVQARVNATTLLPVFVFDPDPVRPSLRMLLKPGADTAAARAAGD